MFTRKDKQDLMEELAQLKGELARTKAEREAVSQAAMLEDDIYRLRETISNLEADKSRVEEKYARERRELEHMVGLERKRQEFEIAQAKRETEVEVREGALEAERERFKEQMSFTRDRMAEEIRYLKEDILKGILERLPTVTVDRHIRERSETKEV